MNKDQKFLSEAYEEVVANLSSFESKIRKQANRSFGKEDFYVFGMTPEGKKYAVIEEYDKYDDGDRWIEETNHRLEIEGEEGKYISDELGKQLMKKGYQEHPELNKHVSQDVMNFHNES